MAINLPAIPETIKQISPLLKIANEHDGRDLVVSYWSRIYALQLGLKSSTKQPDETAILLALMDWLEVTKTNNVENEAITNEVVAQAHLENYALKLFQYADRQDREGNFGKNVVKAFYTCGVICDVLQTFGELSEETAHNRKYAKWKATYIHNCLKNGETPIAGPLPSNENENLEPEADAQEPSNISPITPSEEPLAIPPTAEEVLSDPTKLPTPPKDEERNPGGFVAYTQSGDAGQPYVSPTIPNPEVPVTVTPDQIQKAQKYCKYAASALNFDDVKSAIENLQKAMHLLTTGQELTT